MLVPAMFFNSDGNPTADASIYVGGEFTSYKGTTANGIIKIRPTGNKDTSFDNSTGFSGGGPAVFDILLGDKIYVSGLFSSYKGSGVGNLVKINIDGTRDTSYLTNLHYGNSTCLSMSYAGSGQIYLGGNFNTYDSYTTKNGVVLLNSNSTINTGFVPYDLGIATGGPNAILLTSAGLVVVGGFTSYNGASANRIIRLLSNGSKDTGFDNSTGFNSSVYCVVEDSNSKLYVGGSFTSYKGTTANGIIRLNADGTKDTGFDNSTGFSGGSVESLTIDNNGKIYVGGSFTSYKGTTANYIIKLNDDGSKDTGFDNSTGFNSGSSVYAFAVASNNKVYVGGSFTSYKGTTANHIIKLNADGSKDTSFDNSTGFNEDVRTIKIDTLS